MATPKLHLVDNENQPLPSHIVDAIEWSHSRINSQFAGLCDPAELSNSIEDGARRIAEHEKDHGRLQNVKAFAWRTVSNAVISLLRLRSREIALSPQALERLTSGPGPDSPERIHHAIETDRLLKELSQQEQTICDLTKQGFTTKEIGRALRMTQEAVWKAQSRIRTKLATDSRQIAD